MQWHSAVVATNFTDCQSLFVDGSDGNKVQDLFAAIEGLVHKQNWKLSFPCLLLVRISLLDKATYRSMF